MSTSTAAPGAKQNAPLPNYQEATEGFNATKAYEDDKIKNRVLNSKRRSWLVWLFAIVGALFIELVIFNQTALFFDEKAYPHQVITFPQNESLGQPALVINQERNNVDMQLPDMQVKSVYMRLAHGSRFLVSGRLELRTFASAYIWNPVGTFEISGSGRDEASEAYFKILPKGKVKELRINFEPSTVASGVAIVALELNKPIPLDIKPLRVILLALTLAFVWSLFKSSWRQGCVIVGSKRYRRITRTALVVMLLGSGALFYSMSPFVATDGGFKFIADGVLPYNTPDHRLLMKLPESEEQYRLSDAYTQMLAAYTKGQLHLPYQADPRLDEVTNVYDNSELFAKKIPFLWDHAYHEGKYYVYFGVAPLATIYYPIYLATGEAPCASLAAFIASIYALLALYFGVTRIIRSLMHSVNPLLLSLSLITMPLACGVFMLQGMMIFYVLPYLLGFAAFGLTLGTATSLYTLVRAKRIESKSKKPRSFGWIRFKSYLELLVLGVAVVAMVTSRPLNLIYLVVFMLPLLWFYLRSADSLGSKFMAVLFAGIPVVAGAYFVTWYNQARFGDIFEFGQFKQLTFFDTNFHELTLNFELFFSIIYHYFFENFNLIANFPFVTPAEGADMSMGNGTGFAERGGILFFPLYWALPLLWVLYRKLKHKKQVAAPKVVAPMVLGQVAWQKALVLGLLWTALIVPVLLVVVGINAGLCLRYICDGTLVWAPLAVLALLHLDFSDNTQGNEVVAADDSAHQAIVYWAIVAACLFTCFTSFFLVFSGSDIFSSLNPELMVELKRFFDPLSFT